MDWFKTISKGKVASQSVIPRPLWKYQWLHFHPLLRSEQMPPYIIDFIRIFWNEDYQRLEIKRIEFWRWRGTPLWFSAWVEKKENKFLRVWTSKWGNLACCKSKSNIVFIKFAWRTPLGGYSWRTYLRLNFSFRSKESGSKLFDSLCLVKQRYKKPGKNWVYLVIRRP